MDNERHASHCQRKKLQIRRTGGDGVGGEELPILTDRCHADLGVRCTYTAPAEQTWKQLHLRLMTRSLFKIRFSNPVKATKAPWRNTSNPEAKAGKVDFSGISWCQKVRKCSKNDGSILKGFDLKEVPISKSGTT